MLFKSLSLKNFKCFQEVDVEFAPITLLTGANSSGKSSLIYSILAMLQTEQFPLYLSPNGKYVDMGSMKEMVFQGDSKKEISLTFDTVNDLNYYDYAFFESRWELDQKNELPELSFFKVILGDGLYELLKISDNKYLFNYEVRGFENNELDNNRYLIGIEDIKKNQFLRFGKNNSIENEIISIKEIPFNSIKEFKEFMLRFDDASANFFETIFERIEIFIKEIDSSFNYIGSFRLPPERTYYQKAKAQEKVGVNGEGYIDQIIEWEETDPAKFEELNRLLGDLELIESIKSDKMKGGRFELTVRTKKNSTSAALTDVGFGISQFLPVIVADLQLPDTSCLALSQPEIHLHPKIQALFGNYLANQINKFQKQYIVETHSEYLLNRIRLLLVKGELKPEDVQVYYFENDGQKSIIHRVEFTIDGQIKGAPEGFFDTYGMDVMDIALHA
jgi:predicted ATPase